MRESSWFVRAGWAAVATWTVVLGACGAPGDDDGGGPRPGDVLVVSPAQAALVVRNAAPATQPFTVALRSQDGSEIDVTARTTWTIDMPELGAFSGATFTARGGGVGKSLVHARLDTVTADAQVEVSIEDVRIGEGVPADAPALFAAAAVDPAAAPTMAYPPDGAIVPPNLGDVEVHWRDTAGHDLYELSLTAERVDVRVYLAGGATGWGGFLLPEWTVAARAGDDVQVGVRALTRATPATVGVAPPRTLRLAATDVEGGLYYWAAQNTGGGAYGIFRHDFGEPGTAAEPVFTTTEAGRCVACHALSRDGTRMAVGYDGGNQSSTVVDVASRTAGNPVGSQFWNFPTYSPDGARLVTSRNGVLTVRDGATGLPLATNATVPTGAFSTHPSFAADGASMVYVDVPGRTPGVNASDWAFPTGSIRVIPYDQAAGTWGTPRTLVTGSGNNYYPSFSPDGRWVMFNRSSEDAYDDASAEVWVVPADGSAAPRKLDLANGGAALTNSWPRWAPFRGQIVVGGQIRDLYWITFSSKRAFGVRMAAGRPQLWMAAFMPDLVADGDPTAPAFRLPFQDLATNNHIAQWTEVVVPIGKLVTTPIADRAPARAPTSAAAR